MNASFSFSFTVSARESKIPEPPAGHQWKEVRHDNTVTWLASWTENVQGSIKYIMLNANSKLKVACQSDVNWGNASTSLGTGTRVKKLSKLQGENYIFYLTIVTVKISLCCNSGRTFVGCVLT